MRWFPLRLSFVGLALVFAYLLNGVPYGAGWEYGVYQPATIGAAVLNALALTSLIVRVARGLESEAVR